MTSDANSLSRRAILRAMTAASRRRRATFIGHDTERAPPCRTCRPISAKDAASRSLAAGVAGLTAGWKLANPLPMSRFYEADSRYGGPQP